MSVAEPTAPEMGADESGLIARMLAVIERVGNKVPHPAIMFLALCIGVIVLSQLMAWAGVGATYEVVRPPDQAVESIDVGGSSLPAEVMPSEPPDASDYEVVTETVKIEGLLTADGIRYLFTSFVPNFMGFTAMGIILIVMIGVGVAERSGLIASLIRKLVASSPAGALTYIIVFLGVISSIASDAGYLVLIPLGAAAFASVGRHPLAGMAAAFAGVAGGFGVNLLVTPTDAVLTEITNESIQLVDPDGLDRPDGQPVVRHRLDDHAHGAAGRSSPPGWSRSGWVPTTRPMPRTPAAGRSRPPTTRPTWTPRPSSAGCACPGCTRWRPWR